MQNVIAIETIINDRVEIVTVQEINTRHNLASYYITDYSTDINTDEMYLVQRIEDPNYAVLVRYHYKAIKFCKRDCRIRFNMM